MRKHGRRPGLTALICLLLCTCLCALAETGVEQDEDGGTWDWDNGVYTAPDGATYSITPGGVQEDSPAGGSSSGGQSSGGAMVIDTGVADPMAGQQVNSDGSITIESGQGGVDIQTEPTRAPLTAEEWDELLAQAGRRNGDYTPTFYRDPVTGNITEVQVVYMGIGRSMVVLNGQNRLVGTVNLTWATEAPEDKVLAVIEKGYAWIRMKPNEKITTAKLEQCRMDQVVRVLNTGKNFTFVDHNGLRGYIKTSSLEFFANDHTDYQTGMLSVKGKTAGRETCNVRSRDDSHRYLAEYQQGTPVTVFDIIDDYAQIDVCGWHCTVNTKYLTLEKETASAD